MWTLSSRNRGPGQELQCISNGTRFYKFLNREGDRKHRDALIRDLTEIEPNVFNGSQRAIT